MSLKINGIKPVTISVDNYFVERVNNPKDEHGNYDFECIEALDLDLFNSQLVDLLKITSNQDMGKDNLAKLLLLFKSHISIYLFNVLSRFKFMCELSYCFSYFFC